MIRSWDIYHGNVRFQGCMCKTVTRDWGYSAAWDNLQRSAQSQVFISQIWQAKNRPDFLGCFVLISATLTLCIYVKFFKLRSIYKNIQWSFNLLWGKNKLNVCSLSERKKPGFQVSYSPWRAIDLVMKHILVFFYISKLYSLMRSHLPDHPWIYVPIRLRCSCGIIHRYHIKLHTSVQILRRHRSCFSKCEITDWSDSFQSWLVPQALPG